jgi:hypothetical protein
VFIFPRAYFEEKTRRVSFLLLVCSLSLSRRLLLSLREKGAFFKAPGCFARESRSTGCFFPFSRRERSNPGASHPVPYGKGKGKGKGNKACVAPLKEAQLPTCSLSCFANRAFFKARVASHSRVASPGAGKEATLFPTGKGEGYSLWVRSTTRERSTGCKAQERTAQGF